ncbi:MAG: DUF2804 domain-containing protein [Oleiphilus sp.]
MLQPYSLINSHGKPHIGVFSQPVHDVNYKDTDYRTPLNKRAGKWKKHFHFKLFQYFGGISNDIIFGCALADTAYIGAVFVYVYQISSKKMLTWQFKRPLATQLSLTNRPDNGVSTFLTKNKKIHMRYQLNALGERRKVLDVDFGSELKIHAEMLESPDFSTMALCTPCSINGWVYAQKTAARPVTGELSCNLGHFDLEEQQTFGHHDFSAGYMRRETFWNWACFSGQNKAKTKRAKSTNIGLNVSWGVNETGYSENCFWIDDTLHPLPAVQFKFDRDDEHSTWRIKSLDDRINLSFTPEGMHKEHLNAMVFATHFKQIFGRFHGYLLTESGKRHDIEDCYGFVEDHYSKW